MTDANAVIAALRRIAVAAPNWASEIDLQEAVEHALDDIGAKFKHHPRLGGGIADVLVDCDPRMLIEVKATGDWRSVAEAAAQLFIYRQVTPDARRVMVLGSPPQHFVLREMLMRLDIVLVECC